MVERILGIAKVVPLNSKSYRITLIKVVAELLEIRKGDSVAFIQDETGRIYIRKA